MRLTKSIYRVTVYHGVTMSSRNDVDQWESAETGRRDGDDENAPDGTETVESYELDGGGVVLFDAENPLAWVEATAAVRLSEHV